MVTRSAAEFPDKKIDVEATLAALPPGVAVGRQHLATVLLEHRAVQDRQEAFDGPLRKGRAGLRPEGEYADRDGDRDDRGGGWGRRVRPPLAYRQGDVVDTSVIRRLASVGLGGVEVDHPDHDAEGRATLRALANELGLLATGSSDCHGTNKTTPLAAETTDAAVLEDLISRARGAGVLIGR